MLGNENFYIICYVIAFQVQEAEILKELDKQELKENFGLKNDSYGLMKQKALEAVEGSLETHKDLQGYCAFFNLHYHGITINVGLIITPSYFVFPLSSLAGLKNLSVQNRCWNIISHYPAAYGNGS